MKLNCSSIMEQALGGIGTVIVSAVFIWIYNFIRNAWLEWKLKKALSNMAVCVGDECGIGLRNTTPVSLKIHSVIAKGLKPIGGVKMKFTGIDDESDQSEEPQNLHPGIVEKDNRPGSIVLPPHTTGNWLMPKALRSTARFECKAIRVRVEYPTMFGGSRMITVYADELTLGTFKDFYAQWPKWAGEA